MSKYVLKRLQAGENRSIIILADTGLRLRQPLSPSKIGESDGGLHSEAKRGREVLSKKMTQQLREQATDYSKNYNRNMQTRT